MKDFKIYYEGPYYNSLGTWINSNYYLICLPNVCIKSTNYTQSYTWDLYKYNMKYLGSFLTYQEIAHYIKEASK